MSAITTYNVNGTDIQANFEYTAGAVAEEYRKNLAIFVTVFNLSNSDGDSVINVIDQALANDAAAALANFNTLMANGKVANVDPNDSNSPTKTYFLSVEMARDLDLLYKSLQTVGINPSAANPTVSEDQLQRWKSVAEQTPAIAEILRAAIDDSGVGNRTLQALVELVYVKTGNEVMADALESLESALTVTKASLDTLTELQELHNQLTVKSKDAFSNFFDFKGGFSSTGAYLSSYQTQASQYFGEPINPIFASSLGVSETDQANNVLQTDPGTPFYNAQKELLELRGRIQDNIEKLEALTPPGTNEDGTLLGNLRKVLNDINNTFEISGNPVVFSTLGTLGAGEGFRTWLLDNYDDNFISQGADSSLAGAIQQNITFAITAGESLNDTQKESVRRYLFVFEEYYKSAAAILNKITQIIEKITQGISR